MVSALAGTKQHCHCSLEDPSTHRLTDVSSHQTCHRGSDPVWLGLLSIYCDKAATRQSIGRPDGDSMRMLVGNRELYEVHNPRGARPSCKKLNHSMSADFVLRGQGPANEAG